MMLWFHLVGQVFVPESQQTMCWLQSFKAKTSFSEGDADCSPHTKTLSDALGRLCASGLVHHWIAQLDGTSLLLLCREVKLIKVETSWYGDESP